MYVGVESLPDSEILQCQPRLLNRLQIHRSLTDSMYISLLTQHMSVSLNPNLRQFPPPLQILGVSFVAVGLFCVFPVAFRESQHSCDLFIGNVQNETDDCACFFYEIVGW